MEQPEGAPAPYAIRRVGDRWEVQVWMDCGEIDQDARAIAMMPLLSYEYRQGLRSDLAFANDLEKTGKALAKHGINALMSRFFIQKAVEIRESARHGPPDLNLPESLAS